MEMLSWYTINYAYWDTSISSQVSNYDGVVLEIYLDYKIPLTTGGFELRISYTQSSYLIFVFGILKTHGKFCKKE